MYTDGDAHMDDGQMNAWPKLMNQVIASTAAPLSSPSNVIDDKLIRLTEMFFRMCVATLHNMEHIKEI